MNMSIGKTNVIALICLLFGVFGVNAQEIDTMEINGEQFFVYPFNVDVHPHRDYFNVVDFGSTIEYSFRHYRKEIEKEFGAEKPGPEGQGVIGGNNLNQVALGFTPWFSTA